MDHQGLFWMGVKLFNAGEFFEAHEVWEEVWRESEEPDRSFYQGLIQFAVALAHLERGNQVGFERLVQRAEEHLAGFPASFGGIRLGELRRQVAELVQWVADLKPGHHPYPRGDSYHTLRENETPHANPSIFALISGVKITLDGDAAPQS